jgi:acyl-CoA synthetase (AMP-forming)/AMP-acid ligase II
MLSYPKWVASQSADEPGVAVEEDDPFLIIYTSGTTGGPKVAVYTNRRRMEDTRTWALDLGASAHDRNLPLVPLFHMAGTVIWSFFYTGARAIIAPAKAFSPVVTLRAIQEEKATFIHIVPTQLVALLDVPNFDGYDLSSLSGILYAASPMPVELLKKGMRRFGRSSCRATGSRSRGRT